MKNINPNRPKSVDGSTYQASTECGNAYITINKHEGKIMEVFIRLGKSGGCPSAQNECIGRLTTLAFKLGASIEQVIEQLQGIQCRSGRSCGSALANVLGNL